MDDDPQRFINEMERLKDSHSTLVISGHQIHQHWISAEMPIGNSSIMKTPTDSESNPLSLKIAKSSDCIKLIQREVVILEPVKHPLILELRRQISSKCDDTTSILTANAG
jgi:hypothetical protein